MGVTGTARGVGTTHFCILYGNYLAGVRREKVAVLEWNQTGALERLEQACTGTIKNRSPFRVLDVDYYKNSGGKTLVSCIQKGYDSILIDFGASEQPCQEWHMCDQKMVCGSFSEWQWNEFLGILKTKKPADQGWIFLAAFGSEETRREVEKKLGVPVFRIPFSADAFQVTSQVMEFFQDLHKK